MGNDVSAVDQLVDAVRERERKSLRRAIIYTVVPFIFAVLLITFTTYQVGTAAEELKAISEQRDRFKNDLDETWEKLLVAESKYKNLQRENDRLRKGVAFLREFEESFVSIDPAILKSYSSAQGLSREIMQHLLSVVMDHNPRWRYGGASLDEGFDSPGFALYILKMVTSRYDHLPADVSMSALMESTSRTGHPRSGDIVFYEAGYTMFYYDIPDIGPFVIGMTPIGVHALRPDFGPRILSYGRVEY